MSISLAFDFVVDKENNSITVKREFAADRSLVWAAYTKSEILDQWWAPKPWKARTKSMDFKEGGHWHYAMVGPEGEEHWAWADYKNIEPKHKFTGLDAFADAEGNIDKSMPQSKWNVTFTDKGEELTQVEFHITYPDLAQLEAIIQMGFKEGLSMAMEGLDELLPKLKK
ncbi:MAG: ATPase [Candidatus Fluviicola riflensis]|nr:MAG: ATPase [Candidatus Fluviicola riflensis]OGS77503.1 MAG: ATPase [Candidatus Fluviicola riflensis]OGS84083.1 MAG: ATPase [Fluviicola sp. RIFCSPHIGHO2_12_FULL_43_24]OGS84569.1 MAG: ATPase [Fluviicola sp. RIFCSPHIGHO2_01_FULL_43_53]